MKTAAMLTAICGLLAGQAFGQTMVEGKNFDFAPAEYSVQAPVILGPEKAKGVVIWNHGRGNTAADAKAPPLALQFAQRGWDVYTLYRGWSSDDRTRALQIVGAGVEKAQAMGYKRIVLMGQSAGAYASVEAIRYGYAVEAVIALAPAAHGSYSGSTASSGWRANDFTMRTIWEKYEGKKAKVVAAYFNDDDFYEGQNPNVRGPWLKEKLQALGIPHFVIDQPTVAGLKGHGAGQSWNFARRFGPCIFAFVESGEALPCDEGDLNTLATFQIAPPKPVFDSISPLVGLWYGTWGGGRLIALPISAVSGNRVSARYMTGLGANLATEKAENSDWPLTLTEAGLYRETSATVFEFRQDGDRLIGTRTPKNDKSQKDTIVLQRAAIQVSAR